jgi:integrase
MPRIRLTQAAVEKLKPPASGRIIYTDRHLPGFGLRLTDKNARSWVAMYRVRGKFVMETLGNLALIPKVEDARQRARESMLKARAGTNPLAERREREKVEAEAAVEAKANTFGAVFERYLDRHAKTRQNAKTLAETLRQFKKDILTCWGNREITAITEKDIRRLRDDVHERAPIQANRMLTKIKTLFGWALRERYISVDPTVLVDPIADEKARDRWLSDAEVVRLWHACDQAGWPYGSCVKILALTGQRRDEVTRMEWRELDLERRTWTLPGSKTKNGIEHEIALSPLAIEIIRNLKRIGDRWVFTRDGTKPLSGWSIAKAKIDRLMGDDVQPWVFHDLRRTIVSHMARLGIPAEVADKVLNHSGGSVVKGVAAIYQRHQFRDERREALEKWSAYIEDLLRPSADKVVRLNRSVG